MVAKESFPVTVKRGWRPHLPPKDNHRAAVAQRPPVPPPPVPPRTASQAPGQREPPALACCLPLTVTSGHPDKPCRIPAPSSQPLGGERTSVPDPGTTPAKPPGTTKTPAHRSPCATAIDTFRAFAPRQRAGIETQRVDYLKK